MTEVKEDIKVDFFVQLNEHSFKTPLELFKRNLKEINKLNEKQTTALEAHIIDDENNSYNPQETLTKLRLLISNLEGYKEKLEDKSRSEDDYMKRLSLRMKNFTKLNDIKNGVLSPSEQEFVFLNMGKLGKLGKSSDQDSELGDKDAIASQLSNWYKSQINILIAQYLLKTSDFGDIPNKFLKGSIDFNNLENNSEEISNYILNTPSLFYLHNFKNAGLVDYDLIIRSNLITKDILYNKNGKNLLFDWIKENDKLLKKVQSSLKFECYLTTYIEHIKDSVLKRENLMGLNNLEPITSITEPHSSEVLIFMKNEIYQLSKEDHNKYFEKIRVAMGLLTLPHTIILLFLKYENYLIKNFYKKKYFLKNMNSYYYSPEVYDNFQVIINKKLLIEFLNSLKVSKHQKLIFKNYLTNKNLFSYYKLLSVKRYNYLNQIFVRDYNEFFGLISSSSMFENLLSLGLSALRTRTCVTLDDLKKANNSININSNIDEKIIKNDVLCSNKKFRQRLIKIKSAHCSICSSSQLISLSSQLVFSHHTSSKLSYKSPVILPNNNIYDQEALSKFNESLLVNFTHILESNEEHLIEDYSNLFEDFKCFASQNKENVYQSFPKLVDPLSGEIFPKDHCEIKVFPT